MLRLFRPGSLPRADDRVLAGIAGGYYTAPVRSPGSWELCAGPWLLDPAGAGATAVAAGDKLLKQLRSVANVWFRVPLTEVRG